VRRVLLCTALLLSAPAARAASKSVSLDWVRLAGAESCASSAELVAAVEKRLGREVFTIATKSDLAIEGRVERTKSTWRATIVSRADGKTLGTRVVDSAESSCRALDEAIVLVLAVTIDPDGEAVPPPDPPPPPKPTYVTVVKHVRHDVVVPVEKASEWRADIRLSATGAVGVLPGFAPGARLSGMFEHRAFVPVELDARVLAGASDDADRSTAFNHFSGGVAICPGLGRRLRGEACAGGNLALLRARGAGFDVDYDRTLFLPSAFLRARGLVTVAGPLFCFLGIEAAAALVRARFVVTRPDQSSATIYEQPRFAVIFDAGVGLHFD
jgi:hypothetical protein